MGCSKCMQPFDEDLGLCPRHSGGGENQSGDPREWSRRKLIATIKKLSAMEPIMGISWREGMLRYYYKRLAELTLIQSGILTPDADQIQDTAASLHQLIDKGLRF